MLPPCRSNDSLHRETGPAHTASTPSPVGDGRRGVRVIIDVPSPHAVAISEIWRSRQSSWRRIRTVAADRGAALLTAERVLEQRQRVRNEHRAGNALHESQRREHGDHRVDLYPLRPRRHDRDPARLAAVTLIQGLDDGARDVEPPGVGGARRQLRRGAAREMDRAFDRPLRARRPAGSGRAGREPPTPGAMPTSSAAPACPGIGASKALPG